MTALIETHWRSPYDDADAFAAAAPTAPTLLVRRIEGRARSAGWWPARLCIVASGRVHISAGGLHVPLNAGAIWTSAPGCPFGVTVAPGYPATLHVVLAPAVAPASDGRHLRRWTSAMPSWFDLTMGPEGHVSRLARAAILQQFDRDPATRTVDAETWQHVLQEMRLQQCEIIAYVDACAGRSERHRADVLARLQRVRALLDGHFRGGLSLAEMARIAAMSRLHFQRKFGQAFGVSPFQYFDRRRLALVSELLAEGRVPVIEIARAYGFTGGSAFARWYRQRAGGAPEDFRHMMQSSRAVRDELGPSLDGLLGYDAQRLEAEWQADRGIDAAGDDDAHLFLASPRAHASVDAAVT